MTGLSGCNASAGQETGAASKSAGGGGAEAGAFPVTISHKFGETTVVSEPQRTVCAGLEKS